MRLVFAVLILFIATAAASADCARSAGAALAGHPGGHAVYVTRDGVKCWFLDSRVGAQPRQGGERKAARAVTRVSQEADGPMRPSSASVSPDEDQVRRLLDQLRPLETPREIIVAQLWEVGMKHLIADMTVGTK